MNKRLNNYDLLRIICVISVIVVHVSAMYAKILANIAEISSIDITNINHPLLVSIYYTIGRFSVPIFLMLTGALVLKNPKNKECKYFYKKSFKKIFIPVIVFTIIYIIYTIIIVSMKGKMNFSILLENIIKGKPFYHMWYMYMLIGVYWYIPFVIKFKDKIGEKRFKVISVIFLPIATFIIWILKWGVEWNFIRAFFYLSYVMIGYTISTIETEYNKFKFWVLSLVGIFIELITTYLVYKMMVNGVLVDYTRYPIVDDCAPNIVIASLCIFIAFSNLKIERDYHKVSDLTYYIYLFHAGVLDILVKLFRKIKGMDKFMAYNSNVVMCILIFLVFLISVGLSIFYRRVSNKLTKT